MKNNAWKKIVISILSFAWPVVALFVSETFSSLGAETVIFVRMILMGAGFAAILFAFITSLVLVSINKRHGEHGFNTILFYLSLYLILSWFISYDFPNFINGFGNLNVPMVSNIAIRAFLYINCGAFFIYPVLVQSITEKKFSWVSASATLTFYLIFLLAKGENKALALIPACLLMAYFLGYILPRSKMEMAMIACFEASFPVLVFQVLYISGIMEIDPVGIYSFAMFVPSVLVMREVFRFYYLSEKKAKIATVAESKALRSKQQAYEAQSGPHFVFNSLTYVKGQYHNSIRNGNRALSLLEGNLQAFISFSGRDLIPWNEELSFIRRYAEMANLRKKSDIPLIIKDDLDEDIMIPPLAVEVFVENALRHGDLDKTPGGKIEIHLSKDQKGNKIIEIQDNGIGFDKNANDKSVHTGLDNSEFRINYLLGGTVDIESKINEGTKITITIPKEGKEI